MKRTTSFNLFSTLHAIVFISALVLIFSLPQRHAFSDESVRETAIPVNKIQNIIDRYTSESIVPGIVVGVESGGERWVGCSGIANIETQEPMAVDTQFRLASVTKTFTATLILKLAELGKLSLEDTLEEWLPGKVLNGENITISMLLNHTSGLYDHENTSELSERLVNEPSSVWTEEEVIELVNTYPPNFEPGADYSYSNSGYYLLGMIAEKASNDTVDHLTQQYLFAPSDMNRTRLSREGTFDSPSTPGYVQFDDVDGIVNTGDWNLSWDWTAGSGVSTAGDLLSFVRGLMAGEILSPESVKMMTTLIPPAPRYGFGVVIGENDKSGTPLLSHNGYNPGAFAGWFYYPYTDSIIVFGMNYSEYREEYMMDYLYSGLEQIQKIYDALNPSSSIDAPQWDFYH